MTILNITVAQELPIVFILKEKCGEIWTLGIIYWLKVNKMCHKIVNEIKGEVST